MTTRTNSPRLLGALTVAVALSAPVAALAGPAVPFSGTFTTQEKVGYAAKCVATNYFGGTTTGEGHASHLGAATGIASDCITLGMGGPTAFSSGDLVLTAANGDQLHIVYSGTPVPTATPPITKLTGTFRIDGGTGRFAHAIGIGTLTGLENFVTGQGQLNLDGTIAY